MNSCVCSQVFAPGFSLSLASAPGDTHGHTVNVVAIFFRGQVGKFPVVKILIVDSDFRPEFLVDHSDRSERFDLSAMVASPFSRLTPSSDHLFVVLR